MGRIGIIGAGFVADFYIRSIQATDGLEVVGVWDIDGSRLGAFCKYWGLPECSSLEGVLARAPDLILNLTNPAAHYEISRACLEAGVSVYSEKPLAMTLADARHLHALAAEKGLALASAPCSVLGESAQTLWRALREQTIGRPRLVYAEIDDGYLVKAPFRSWKSESGAPWPAGDEFAVGCTLEHAGYYLTWLIAMFGSVEKVVSASANALDLVLENGEPAAPNYASATLFFANGVVARLTCTIVAPHDHSIRIFGDDGTLEVDECWSNGSPVRIRRRHVVRRRLIESPVTRRYRLAAATHPKVGRRGATAMNFALGPLEVIEARKAGRRSRLCADLALHLTEVTLAIQGGSNGNHVRAITSRAPAMEPMPWAA